ncbi:LCP family protein [Streptomyces sp. NPDC001691]|uniref:LCP family protein n=1 Tax=unclassified Streptomyces TaxID=2593676 RepID=UPI000DEAFDC3|nr:LCP family protein [Streptomyces sp. SDr-06]RCH65912.1 LytR family transcriptional regulator [Streptomyces sp. SDr-06]
MRLATTLSVLVLGAGGVGHAVMTSLDGGIGRVDPFRDMKNRPQGSRGTNILLVGTDGRDKITPEEKQKYRLGGAPCHCTDTIMMVHVSAERDRVSVVSLPRDSYAEVPERTDEDTGRHHPGHPVKLNAAYAEGGPALTVSTIENMTGLKIDHYLEVDFTSFMKTVDVVGGVQICTARPMKDSYTGIDLAAGTHQLNGGEALQYVRSRHTDGSADLGRMQRQQRFLAALVAKATSNGVLLNPVKFREVASSLLSSVRADEGFGVEEMLSFSSAMKGFSPSSSDFTTVPLGQLSFPVKGIGSTVKWDDAKAKKLFQLLREDKPLAPHAPPKPAPQPAVKDAKPPRRGPGAIVEVAPEQIRVQVYNGTRTDGLGRRVDDALHATGFRTSGSPQPSANLDMRRTLIEYDPRWDRSARSLAIALPGSELRPVKGLGATMKVTAGADFKDVVPVRAEEQPQGDFGTVTGDQVVCP